MTEPEARSDGHLTIRCSHLKEPLGTPPPQSELSTPEPFRVTLKAGETFVAVLFCAVCAQESGATEATADDRRSLEVAALKVLRKDLEARLGDVIGGIGEIGRLLRHPNRPDEAQERGFKPEPHRDDSQVGPPSHSTRHRRSRRTSAADRHRPIGRRISGIAHTHVTPALLALDLDEGGERLEARIYRRVSTCVVCCNALEELSRWLVVLDHCDPVLGEEFVTRHDFFNQLLADHRSHAERLEAIRSDELFHQWGLCRLLIEESRSCRETNAELSAELGELATTVAGLLDPGFYRPERVADQRALTAADYGDALRVLGETEAAGCQFEIARELLKLGTGRTRITSGIARLEAGLLRNLSRHDEAHEFLKQAIAAHEQNDEEPRTVLQWILESCTEGSGGEVAHGAAQDEAR